MSLTTKERTELRAELKSVGYKVDYVDSWPAKTTLYRHKAQKSVQGVIVKDVGTSISGVPGQPMYIRDKAKQGLLAWPPSEGCECRWCLESRTEKSTDNSKETKSVSGTRRGAMGPHFNKDS